MKKEKGKKRERRVLERGEKKLGRNMKWFQYYDTLHILLINNIAGLQIYSTEYQFLSIILKLFSVIVFFPLDLLLQKKERREGAGGEREGEILYSSITLPQKNFATENFNNQGFFFYPQWKSSSITAKGQLSSVLIGELLQLVFSWILNSLQKMLNSILHNRLACSRLLEHLLSCSLPPSFSLFSLFLLCLKNCLHLNPFLLFLFMLLIIHFFQTGYTRILLVLFVHTHSASIFSFILILQQTPEWYVT